MMYFMHPDSEFYACSFHGHKSLKRIHLQVPTGRLSRTRSPRSSRTPSSPQRCICMPASLVLSSRLSSCNNLFYLCTSSFTCKFSRTILSQRLIHRSRVLQQINFNQCGMQWPAAPVKEWCPPGHGDLYPSLAGSGAPARTRTHTPTQA